MGDSVTLSVDDCPNLNNNLQNGLVAYYPFCGNANDESANTNDGTINGAVLTQDRFGHTDAAYDFDGIDDFINLGDLDLTSSFTLNAWIKPNTISGVNNIIHKKQSLNLRAGYTGVGTDKLYGYVQTTGTNYISYSSSNPAIGTWQMVTMIYDEGNEIKLYIGAQEETIISQIGTGTINQNNYPMHIGSYSDTTIASNEWFDGTIDDVTIYNRTLDTTEIQQLYTLGQYDISWSTGDTTSSITVSPTATTTYSVTVDDGISTCSDSVAITVSGPAIAFTSTDVSCNGAADGTAAAIVTNGVGPY
ncbi:MAG TPA: hypothetical protein EYN51_01070, partial [Flavobacteriales bacterium]|nr:hypothetical protein [Flavobacteriales bacterium]